MKSKRVLGRCTRTTAMVFGVVAMMAGSVVFTAASAKTVLIAAHAASTINTGHKALEFMAKELKERTDDRITMKIYPSAQLGSEREVVESIQLGNVDLTFVSSAVLGAFEPKFYVLDIPFLFQQRPVIYRLLDGEFGQILADSLHEDNLKVLAYWENGFRQLTNNVHPIHSPKDLQGMKMRTMENQVHIAMWQAMGANPAPLAFGELFTALQQGTFNAQEGPINLFYDMKFYEVQDYITRTNHIYSAWPVLINPDVYASFSDEDRAIFDQVVKETTEYQRNLAKKADEKAIEAMDNVEITKLTPEQLNAFKQRVVEAGIVGMVRERAGDKIVDTLMADLKTIKAELAQ